MKVTPATAALFAATITLAQGTGPELRATWSDHFNDYKAAIRPLDPAATKACETQLRRILKMIDDNAACTADSDCTLLDQDPFGSTVPLRAESAAPLLSDMKRFRHSCDNGSIRSIRNNGVASVPACVKNRCMVRSSRQAVVP